MLQKNPESVMERQDNQCQHQSKTKQRALCGGHDQGRETTAVWSYMPNVGQSMGEASHAGDGRRLQA